jgi:hypothetical protein
MSVVMLWTPGAATATSGPKFEPHHSSPSWLVRVLNSSYSLLANTVRTLGRLPGKSTGPLALPAAITITHPLPLRPWSRACSKALIIAEEGHLPPNCC